MSTISLPQSGTDCIDKCYHHISGDIVNNDDDDDEIVSATEHPILNNILKTTMSTPNIERNHPHHFHHHHHHHHHFKKTKNKCNNRSPPTSNTSSLTSADNNIVLWKFYCELKNNKKVKNPDVILLNRNAITDCCEIKKQPSCPRKCDGPTNTTDRCCLSTTARTTTTL